MKKWIGIILVIMLAVGICGCAGQETPPPAPEELTPPVTEDTPKPNAFYERMQKSFRPIAVMIDNDNGYARPQKGLESAYIVYEIVVEGSATRFLALFDEAKLDKVGPIRSSRHYFLDYATEHDAIYVHAGWSDKAAAEITSRGINNINGLTDSGFWRDYTYDRTWHNLYTGLDKVSALAEKKGYRQTADQKVFSYLMQDEVPDGEDAKTLFIPYANFYNVKFVYNPETHLYERYVNGAPHKSQTGDVLCAKNIILYTLSNVSLNDGIDATRQDLKNVGQGTGYYLSEGKAVEINWSKPSRSDKTQYTYSDGASLQLNPGNTYVQIVPAYAPYTIE